MTNNINIKAAFEARLKRRIATHPELYPQYATAKKLTNTTTTSDNLSKLLDAVRNKPFWIFDEKQHDEERQRHAARCCWNHTIGLPDNKPGLPQSLFPYEKLVIDAFEQHKHIWILKATGLGITELTNPYLCYLATRNNDLRGSQMCIVTGPRLELATT